ncbi:unnamed protein product [Durusdinium trenchii]|uniref:2'-phosphotransferase n=2 Tax=Durusdinium trenchii TaxID=1381693 RepID=A0ABP0QI14_9DINO
MELADLERLGLCVVQLRPIRLTLGTSQAENRRPTRAENRTESGSGRERKMSKTLSLLLRHSALDFDIEVRPDGYCLLQEVLACPLLSSLNTTQADVERIVAGNDKKRFELKEDKEDGHMIRAVQGHSMKVVDDDQLLQNVDLKNLPDCCVHGTYRKYFESIKAKGLLAGGRKGQSFRNHVHFSSFNPGDKRVISGMRYDCEIAIWIDLKRAIEDGVPFFLSTNRVILSPGISGVIEKKYFTHARDLQKNEDLPLDS